MRSSILLALCLPLVAGAQVPDVTTTPFVFGAVHTWRSTVLGEPRVLNVYVPDGYAQDSTATFPVIYVLDGSYNEDFPHIAGLAQFMNMYELLPKSIVVGIANVDRYRDFTHPSAVKDDMDRLPQAGGSEKFMAFLELEVVPLVQREYRTSGPRTLIGQSLGGLVALELFCSKPGLFQRYVVVSPSLWWAGGSLLKRTEERIRTLPAEATELFLALGMEGDEMAQGMDTLVGTLRTHARAPFQWWYVPFPEESHATILHRAVYRAFEAFKSGR
jgi:uncharacterized protein